jgi:hypothetical protein
MVTYDVQPEGVLQKAVSALRMSGRALRTDLLRYKAFVEMTDEDDVAEGGTRGDSDRDGPRRKRSGARRRRDEDVDDVDETYDEAEDDYESDEAPEGDEEETDAPARTVRRRAPARSGQKARQRR